MANQTIPDLTALGATVAAGDLLEIADISNANASRKVTQAELVANAALGTPTSLVGTNITGTAAGLTAGTASAVAVGGITGLGTGVGTALAVNVGSAGAPVVNGGALGSPSSAGTIPAFTLGGTVAGGGNQINNVIIGTTTPLAGTFTTVTAGSTNSLALGTAGSAVGNILVRNATSGTLSVNPPTGALGAYQVTWPNAASTLPIYGQQITYAGPTAARTVTYPDANFTVARTDAANTFTGVQTMTSPAVTTSITTGSTTFALFNATATTVNAFGATTALNIGASAATVLNFGGFTSAAELRFLEPSGSGTNYSGFKQPALTTSITYLLPADAPANGDVLTSQTDGTLSWEPQSGAANAVTAASAAGSSGLLWTSGGADRTAIATNTITTINATTANVTNLLPVSNDGAAIGASGTAFSDLFLASGAVINFNAGNLTLTHSAGVLTSNGAYVGTTGTFSATTSLLLGTAGSAVGNVGFRNATSGTATLAPPTGALGTYTVTLPNAASTLPIFGQQITFAGPTAARTVTLPDASFTVARTDAANTFTGVQTMTSPVFTTPVLGTPSSGNLSSCTADGTNAVGYRNVPQNAKTGSYTLLATDVGKVVPNTTGGWTVNNSVHTAGDVVTVYNDSASSQNITAGTITTMRLAGTTTTGTRALAARGLATLYFQTASEVVVSGAGVT